MASQFSNARALHALCGCLRLPAIAYAVAVISMRGAVLCRVSLYVFRICSGFTRGGATSCKRPPNAVLFVNRTTSPLAELNDEAGSNIDI